MTLDQNGLMALKCGGKVYQSYYGNIGIIKVLIVVVCGESHQMLHQYFNCVTKNSTKKIDQQKLTSELKHQA